ncbi:hypothetical protein J2S74_000748 [Evansella vedderi]|uniref:FAD dependent oxidoreductase n=2 Tax=Evansella vedderi TaxID=38282 RepID=A0ABT9ZRL2_9BACI|nr:hypothetical protein [Evansella vedderi]
MEDNKIVGVIIENKDGRSVIKGKVFIDATGDGDVAAKAGAPYVFGKDGSVQSPTMVCRMNNVNWDKALQISSQEVGEKIDEAVKSGSYDLPRRHIFLFPSPHKNEALINATRIAGPDNAGLYGTSTNDLTWSEFEGRKQIREYERFLKRFIPGFESAYIIDSATQIGIRQTRTVVGEYTLMNDDVIKKRKFKNAIVRSAWPIEAHGTDGVKIVHLDDDYYEVPFEVMLPEKVDQLLTVGRCISAEHEALASVRVTAQCFEEGFAAGYAATLSVKENITPKQVDIHNVRDFMISNGSEL